MITTPDLAIRCSLVIDREGDPNEQLYVADFEINEAYMRYTVLRPRAVRPDPVIKTSTQGEQTSTHKTVNKRPYDADFNPRH